ncbi:MAG: hypothetical protein AAGA58_01785 [Verrucomicrobiota bacterium]
MAISHADEKSPVTSTVGLPATIEQLVIPAPKVVAKSIEDRRSPVVVRVVDIFPHGDAFRYNLEFYGLEPGEYDLREYLQHEDGSALADTADPINVKVEAVLPPEEFLPADRTPEQVGRFGGYKFLLGAGIVGWLLGFWMLLFFGKKRKGEDGNEAEKKLTFADRLRPLVKQAKAGKLDDAEMARLERLVLGFWRDKLDLGEEDASSAVPKLRAHDEAGKLLRTIERWVHDPRGREEDVDLAALLEPYAKEKAS